MAQKVANKDGTMPILEHLMELRHRLMICILAVGVGTIAGFVWYQHGVPALGRFPGIPSLGEILKAPYCRLPDEYRASLTADGQCKLLATSPFEMFMLRFKVAAMSGAVMAAPVWLIQIWRFVTPGLLKNERRWTLAIGITASVLFVTGAVLAYLVLSMGLNVLLSLGDSTQTAALTGHEYFSFVVALILIFGVSFEVPLFTAMLNLAGVLHYDAIKDKRSIIIVVMFIFAAIATPGQDPVSMLVLAVALTLLMEFAIQFTRIHDKRVQRDRPEWANLADDEASALDLTPEPVGAAVSVGTGTPARAAATAGAADGAASSPGAAGTIAASPAVSASGSVTASSAVSASGTVAASGSVAASQGFAPAGTVTSSGPIEPAQPLHSHSSPPSGQVAPSPVPSSDPVSATPSADVAPTAAQDSAASHPTEVAPSQVERPAPLPPSPFDDVL